MTCAEHYDMQQATLYAVATLARVPVKFVAMHYFWLGGVDVALA